MQQPETNLQQTGGEPARQKASDDGRSQLVAEVLRKGFTQKLFPSHLQLVPQMHELYEMELASAEAGLMSDRNLVRNAAYFARVGNEWTRHLKN